MTEHTLNLHTQLKLFALNTTDDLDLTETLFLWQEIAAQIVSHVTANIDGL